MVPEDITARSLVRVDGDVVKTSPEILEADIMFRMDVNEESENEIEEISEEIVGIVHEKPSRSDVENALDVSKDSTMYCDEGMKKFILQLEKLCENERLQSLKQGDIRDSMRLSSSKL